VGIAHVGERPDALRRPPRLIRLQEHGDPVVWFVRRAKKVKRSLAIARVRITRHEASTTLEKNDIPQCDSLDDFRPSLIRAT
jgi:hypothetical protein